MRVGGGGGGGWEFFWVSWLMVSSDSFIISLSSCSCCGMSSESLCDRSCALSSCVLSLIGCCAELCSRCVWFLVFVLDSCCCCGFFFD